MWELGQGRSCRVRGSHCHCAGRGLRERRRGSAWECVHTVRGMCCKGVLGKRLGSMSSMLRRPWRVTIRFKLTKLGAGRARAGGATAYVRCL
eukprot:1751773-Pleurochrysis_carterae.AAC.1